jgi:hypothetical protein
MKPKQYNALLLAQSLDGNEAQYVLKHLQSNNLLQLFKYYRAVKNTVNTEDDLKVHNAKISASLPVLQNHLYNEIQRLLVLYNRSEQEQIFNSFEVMKLDMLRNKLQLKQYEQSLNKLLKSALAHSQLDIAINCLERLLAFAGRFVDTDAIKLVAKYSNQLHIINEEQHAQITLRYIFYNLLTLLTQNRYFIKQKDLNAISNYKKQLHELKKFKNTKGLTNFYYLSASAMTDYLELNFEGVTKTLEELENNVRKYTVNIAVLQEYFVIRHYYINSLFTYKRYQDIEAALLALKNVKLRDPIIDAARFGALYCNETRLLASTFNYKGLKTCLNFLRNNYMHYLSQLSADMHSTLFGNCVLCSFAIEKYDDCIFWYSIFNSIPKKNIRKDAFSFMRIFLIIIYVQQQNYEALDSQFRKLQRSLQYEKTYFKCEKIILQYAKRILNGDSLIADTRQLSTELKLLMEDEYERQPLRYFNLIGWCQSVMDGISYKAYNMKVHSALAKE